MRSGVLKSANSTPIGAEPMMNQPISGTAPPGATPWRPSSTEGRISTVVAPRMPTTCITPKTRDLSWYLAAITEAQAECDRVRIEVPM